MKINGLEIKEPFPLMFDATNALLETDVIAIRCYKAGIPFPTEWQKYTVAVRDIVNGTDTISTELPAKPDLPVGFV